MNATMPVWVSCWSYDSSRPRRGEGQRKVLL